MVCILHANSEPLSNCADERLRALEEKFKVMEVYINPRLDVVDICPVPYVVIPQKFKVPDFEKYKRVSCPKTHLRAYCRKMVAYSDNGKLFIHYFQDSLNGESLE